MATKAINPHIVHHPLPDKGTAQAIAALERRVNTIESKLGVIGAGSVGPTQVGQIDGTTNVIPASITNPSMAFNSITATTIAAQAISTYLINGNTITLASGLSNSNKVLLDSTGIRAYDGGGALQITISASDGSILVTKGTITGAIIQTGGSAIGTAGSSKVMMDSTGLNAYDGTGNNTVTIDTNGQLTVRRGSITLSATVPAGTTARVTLDSSGIKGYAAGNPTPQFLLDATSGLITATGVITNQPGSTVPWQTSGFIIGGGNLLPNASAEDPSTTRQIVFANTGAGVTAGTFTLQYGTGTITAAINWNGTAAQMQTTLSAAGVLPSGVTATCSGGPLPGTPVTIDFTGAGLTPPVLTIPTSSLTGGSANSGAVPASGYSASWPNSWWASANGALGFLAEGFAWHGGNVFGLMATGFSAPNFTNSVKTGPLGLVSGTKYTLSGYYRSNTATGRTTATVLKFYDSGSLLLSTFTSTPQTIPVGSWVRDLVTGTVPTNAVYMSAQFGVNGAAASELYFMDGLQLECGDAPTAFAPRPDEIVANVVQANMVNVAQLSAISANLGTISAGTLNAVTINSSTLSSTNTITGAVIQTSSGNPKIVMDSTGIYMTDSSGTKLVTLSTSGGLDFSESIGSAYLATDALSWSDSGGVVREWVQGANNGGSRQIVVEAKAGINDFSLVLCSATSGGNSAIQIQAGSVVRILTDNAGIGNYPLLEGPTRLQRLGLPARAYRNGGFTLGVTGSVSMRADTVAYDPGSHMNTAVPVVYTCPATGYYLFVGQIRITTSAAAYFVAQILKNVTPNGTGGQYTGGSVAAQGTQVYTATAGQQYATAICNIISCTAGDTLEMGFALGGTSSTSMSPGGGTDCYYAVQQLA